MNVTSIFPPVPSGSLQFNGSNYLIASPSYPVTVGTGQFTIECYVYAINTNASTFFGNFMYHVPSDGNEFAGWRVLYNYTNTGIVSLGVITAVGGASTYFSTTSQLPLNAWNHVAFTRDASNIVRVFLNGVLESTSSAFANTLNFSNSTTPPRPGIGADVYSSGQVASQFTGQLTDIRVVTGNCLYTNTFTLPTQPLTNISGSIMLLNSVYGENFIIDSAQPARVFTNVGSVTSSKLNPYYIIRDSFKIEGNGFQSSLVPEPYQFRSKGVLFNGLTATNLRVDGSYDFSPAGAGAGEYTVECFINPAGYGQSGANRMNIFDMSDGGFGCYLGGYLDYIQAGEESGSADRIIPTTNYNFIPGTWYHIAIVIKQPSYNALFINGKYISSRGWQLPVQSGNPQLIIGANRYFPQPAPNFYGTISNFRITKGQALYTIPADTPIGGTCFIPPSDPLTTTSQGALAQNVTLLTCKSSTYIDTSTQNTKTILFGEYGGGGTRTIVDVQFSTPLK